MSPIADVLVIEDEVNMRDSCQHVLKKMERLTAELSEQFKELEKFEAEIKNRSTELTQIFHGNIWCLLPASTTHDS